MEQLIFEFGLEHPRNQKRVQTGILIGLVRNIAPLSLAEMICEVQPMKSMSSASSSIFSMKVRRPFVPSPDVFELTEPFSETDMVEGCFGPYIARANWQRAGICNENCGHRH